MLDVVEDHFLVLVVEGDSRSADLLNQVVNVDAM